MASQGGDAEDNTNWIFVEDAHLLQVAKATSLGGLAALAHTRVDWSRKLNRYAADLVNGHVDMPPVVRRFIYVSDVDPADPDNVVTIRISRQKTRFSDGFGPVFLLFPERPWFEFLALLSDLRLTVGDGVTNLFPSTDRLLERIKTSPRAILDANSYGFLALAGYAVDTRIHNVLRGAVLRADGDSNEVALEEVLTTVDLFFPMNPGQQSPFYNLIVTMCMAECNTVYPLRAFFNAIWVSVRAKAHFKLADDNALYTLGRRLIEAYDENWPHRFNALWALGQYVRFKFQDILPDYSRHNFVRDMARHFLACIPPEDPEDGERLRQYNALRLFFKDF